jgi:signal transduction histidine kinase
MKAAGARNRGWGQAVGLTGLLFVLVSVLSSFPVIRDWQVRVTDTFFRLAPAPGQKSQVLLVTIDDESLQRYGRWPWSRTLLAQLTNNLEQAGAGVVGLDILLSEPQPGDADKVLQEALQAGHTVIVDKIAAYPDGPKWMEPLPPFAESAAVGHAQAVLDADSVCRRYPAYYVTLNGPRWPFAVEVARRTDAARTASFLSAYGVPVADDAAPVSRAEPALIRIPFRRGGFDTISAATALHGLDPATVRGRPVLVGYGSAELGDRLSTPLRPEFPTSGVEVHAQILDGILTGRAVRDIPLWASALVLLATGGVAIVIFRKWRGFVAMGALLFTAAAAYGVALLVFIRGSLILPAGSMMLAIVVAPLLVYTADFVLVERSVTQQLLGLRSWLALRTKDGASREKTDLSWRLELLQQLQTELGSLYELHTALLESTQDLIAIFDQQGKLLLNNRPFAAAHGLAANGALTLEQVRALWKASDDAPVVQNGAIEEAEVSLDKELYSARIAPMPSTRLTPAGGTIVTLTSLRTRVERDRARAEALGFITHELRTPLASVQGFAELMMRYPNSPACANAPETIFRESKRLLALISSYLDVLRLDAGAKSVSMQVIELEGVVRQVFDILRPLANAAGMRLVFEDEEPLSVMGDAPLVNGAVLNLVSNAIKYGQPGTDIKIRCFRDNDEVIISVHNLGKPIAEEEISRLFDPYYRASNVRESKTGWGLGLAFVKRIAEKHGGSVEARSEPSGIVFEIHLPAQMVPAVVTKEIL